MDRASLQGGFWVGRWLIDPRRARASLDHQTIALTDVQVQVLIELAVCHGRSVEQETLGRLIWPGQDEAGALAVDTALGLQRLLVDASRDPLIVPVEGGALALLPSVTPVLNVISDCTDRDQSRGQRRVSGLHWLLRELRRRNVLKVAASYLFAMWIILQVAEVTFAPLKFPDWWMTALTILAITGLPIIVVLAWTYEITPAGIVIDPGDGSESGSVMLPRARQSVAPFLVLGVALMAGVTGFAWWRSIEVHTIAGEATASTLDRPSIAVLSLVDTSSDEASAFLGKAISEAVSTNFGELDGLRVATAQIRSDLLDQAIAQSLGVRYSLKGSVQRTNDRLTVRVHLVDLKVTRQVWSGEFAAQYGDVLSMTDQISQTIAEILQTNSGVKPVVRVAALDADTLDAYLRGLASFRNAGDVDELQVAEAKLRAVINSVPSFAGGRSGLCTVLALQLNDDYENAAVFQKARAACLEALLHDPTSVSARKALGGVYLASSHFSEALHEYSELVRVKPADPDAYVGLGRALAGLKRSSEAEAILRKAISIDTTYWLPHATLGQVFWEQGKFDLSINEFTRATEIVPLNAGVWLALGSELSMTGDMASAERALKRAVQIEPTASAFSNLATSQYYVGNVADAVRNFERALKYDRDNPVLGANLADALWWIESRRPEAIAMYRKALALSEAKLETRPNDATLRAQVGYYFGRVGDATRSNRFLDEALALGPDEIYVHYFRAVSAVDRNDRPEGLAEVSELVRLGYPRHLIGLAPEFQQLQREPEFIRMLQEVGR